MEFSINVEDYLSQEEIKEMCREHVRTLLKSGGERVATNMAYHAAYKLVDDAFTAEDVELLRQRVKKIVTEVSSFHLFREPDVWDKEPSLAYSALQEATMENIPALQERVAQVMREYDVESAVFSNNDVFAEVVCKALRKGFQGE